MKLPLVLLVLLVVTMSSCNRPDNTTVQGFKPKILKTIHTLWQAHEVGGYTHYVTMEGYDENEYDNFFVSYADKYRDTCRTSLPIWGITFCKPFKFIPHDDSQDDGPLRKHSIITIAYTEETLHKEYPSIESITFYKENGQPVYVHVNPINRKERDGRYYDSTGAYNREWIKDFDKKFKTHWSDSSKAYSPH